MTIPNTIDFVAGVFDCYFEHVGHLPLFTPERTNA